MQEDRASWWFFLPILVLVMGVVPLSGLQTLLDASRIQQQSSVVEVDRSDLLKPYDAAHVIGAVESSPHKQQRKFRLLPVVVELAFEATCQITLGTCRVFSAPGLPASSPGSVLYQFHTLSLQL